MDCQSCQSLLAEYALGQLSEDERELVERHLASGCLSCRQELREVEEAWVHLADTLPPVAVPEQIGAALRERIARAGVAVTAQRPARAAFTPEQDELALPDRRSVAPLAMVVAASIFLAVAIGGIAWLGHRDGELESLRQEAARRAREVERLQTELSRANEVFAGGRLYFASLREDGLQSAVRGYVVWDRLSRQIHFYVFNLPPLPSGRVHRVWLLGEQTEPVLAGTLAPQADRGASTIIDVPGEVGDQFRVAVVDQPVESANAPAGEPWLITEVE